MFASSSDVHGHKLKLKVSTTQLVMAHLLCKL
jgi:hypothetical protein